jgi:transcriptional accessory protein Tex/SPT6
VQELDAPLRREAVRYIVAALKDPLSDARDSMPKPALRADVPRMTDLTIGKIVEGVATNITTFGIFVDIGMKQTGFVHKTEVSNNAADTPASVANVGDVLRARVTSLDFQRDRIVLSLRNVPAEGESVPIPEQNTAESTNNNNTNVMTENQPTSTLTSDGAWEEAHDEGVQDENIEMHAEADDVESGGEQEQEQEAAEEFDEPQGEEGEEYAQDMQTEDYDEEEQVEEQQGEEQQHDEELQDDEQLLTAHDTTDASTGTDGNNFEEQ